jgi:hypothetical protein
MSYKITSNEEYQALLRATDKLTADRLAAASGFFAPTASAGALGNPSVNKYDQLASGLKPGENRVLGGAEAMSLEGMLGGKNSTGWLSLGLDSLGGISDSILGYKQFQETKKMNAEKLALLQESNQMKKLQMKNKVNQANRYAMLGIGNSNSQGATLRAVNSTPYTSMV